MLRHDAFRVQPVLTGSGVQLLPLTEDFADDYWAALGDPEVQRLTGTHQSFERGAVEQWLRTRREQDDRADWAIVRRWDGAFLGEAVINDFDPDNESASYRVWLAGSHVGQGYGTGTTQLVVAYALDEVRLHRLSLEVFEHNPRARRVYEKCGFVVEGRLRDALLWDGRRYDTVTMAVLRTDARTDAGRISATHR